MTLFQYIDSNIERTSPSKSASWKRKHYNSLHAVKAYCNYRDADLTSFLLPGWMEGLKEYYSNPEQFSESTARQYKDIFKSLYASAINSGLLPPIKLNELCKDGWDEREEQNYKNFDLLSQIKILDYKNLDKEHSNIRDLYLLSMVCMGADFSVLLSLEKSALQDDLLEVEGLKFRIPPLLLDKINIINAKAECLLPIKAFYRGEARDAVKALKLRVRNLFKSLNLNLYQNENSFVDWLIIAKEVGVSVEDIQQIIALKSILSSKGYLYKNHLDQINREEARDYSSKSSQQTIACTKLTGLHKEPNTLTEKLLARQKNSPYLRCELIAPTSTPKEISNAGINSISRAKEHPSLAKTKLTSEELTQLVYKVNERIEVFTSNWYLVRILKNHLTGEQLVKKLKKDGINLKPSDYYAPIYKIKTIQNGITKIVNSSDTAKMLFVHTSLKQAQGIERIDGGGITIARNIRGGKYAIIPYEELQRMRNFLEGSNQEIFLLQNSDYIGRKVEVTKGQYAGWIGEIVKKSTSAIQHKKKSYSTIELTAMDQFQEDYDNTIFIVQFLNQLKWAIPVSGLEFRFIDE